MTYIIRKKLVIWQLLSEKYMIRLQGKLLIRLIFQKLHLNS